MMRRRRMGRPGLVGTMARTAVVAGTATAVVGGVHNHQAQKQNAQLQAQQDQQAAQQQAADSQQQVAQMQAEIDQMKAQQAPPADAAPSQDPLERLQQLADMKAQGLLTDDEFTAMKAKLLAS